MKHNYLIGCSQSRALIFLLALCVSLSFHAQNGSDSRTGHYIEAHLGCGYGSLGYGFSEPNSTVSGSVSGQVQLQYAYFFHPNCGIGAGLWFTNYTSYARLGGSYQWKDQTDSDGEFPYDHTATIVNWRERETYHNVGIPVSLQFQVVQPQGKAGFFASVGVAPAFSVYRTYHVLEGEVAHSGYYPSWGLTLADSHEFQTYSYQNDPVSEGPVWVPQVDVFADLGTVIPLTSNIDFFIGGYFNYAVTAADKASEKTPLGWKDEHFAFMNAYPGAHNSDIAGLLHPWEAGLKIGIHWHSAGRTVTNNK